MSFRNVSSTAAFIFLALCITLIAFPEIIYWLFSLQGNELGNFLAKRAGLLFLGLSILCFLSRNSTSSEVKFIVSASVGSAMGLMAVLGIYELANGIVGTGILIPVLIETVISALFFRIWMQTRLM